MKMSASLVNTSAGRKVRTDKVNLARIFPSFFNWYNRTVIFVVNNSAAPFGCRTAHDHDRASTGNSGGRISAHDHQHRQCSKGVQHHDEAALLVQS
jgi:hypothetical protein